MNTVSQLSCSVDSCENYKNGYCSLSLIEVSGVEAGSSAETNCKSFLPKSGSFISESRLECPYSNIKCNAQNCIYNSGGNCNADYVDIEGHDISQSADTVCSTFRSVDI